MSSNEHPPILSRPPGELSRIRPGAGAIMNRLVKDAMATQERWRQPNRRRIGDYEFRELDYSQILIWASAVGTSPEDLVAKLQEAEDFTVSEG